MKTMVLISNFFSSYYITLLSITLLFIAPLLSAIFTFSVLYTKNFWQHMSKCLQLQQ
jgi:hypothetical protein